MKKIVCDICHKEITPADIHVNFNINIEDKVEQLDLHNICFIQLRDAVKEIIRENEEKISD